MSSINNISTPTETKQKTPENIFNHIIEVADNVDSKCCGCIYRVPEELRKLKESAYTPQLVSIGPLHSNDIHILKSPVQDVKMSYVNALLCRVEERSILRPRKLEVLTECVDQMQQLIGRAKKCYAEQVEALNEEMLVIDGCFILELLYRLYLLHNNNTAGAESRSESNKPDPIFDLPLGRVTVLNDLLLLENQLPLFVLEELFKLTVVRIRDRPVGFSLIDYVLSFLRKNTVFACTTPETRMEEIDYHHILHILHYHNHHNENPARKDGRIFESMPCALELEHAGVESMPCASELEYAGVEFHSPDNEKDLFMVEFRKPQDPFRWFKKAQFVIPTLSIDDSTEVLMRNLIAFEQISHGVQFTFTSYAYLIDQLVNTWKDVKVLERAGVITSALGNNEEVSLLFNKLCKEVCLPPESFYYAQTCDAAAKFSKLWWPRAFAYLRRTYFANPWTFIAFCAAFIAFAITVVSFILSFVS